MNSNWFTDLFISQAKPAIIGKGGAVSEDVIKNSVEDWLEENPVTGGLSEEEVKDIVEDHLEKNPAPGGSGKAIIDVVELPTENIETGVFYRLLTAKCYFGTELMPQFVCYCVDGLPENAIPCTTTMEDGNFYYNTQDGQVYGYVDAMVSAGAGVPVGWYTVDLLAPAFGVESGGVINSLSGIPNDSAVRVFVKHETYIYDNGWAKVPFAYEFVPDIDINWNGDMTGHPALDMSMLGFASGMYFVKVSDDVLTTTDVIGSEIEVAYYDYTSSARIITEEDIDASTYPGAFSASDYITVVYDENALSSALGIPAGIYPNGVYFWLYTEEGYVTRLTGPSSVIKIDSKYLDVDVDLSVVQEMIDSAIGNAIGGSY